MIKWTMKHSYHQHKLIILKKKYLEILYKWDFLEIKMYGNHKSLEFLKI
jgi:hypothetical protein